MSWILSKIRVVNIGLFICVFAPCFVFANSAKSPEAIIQLFYKALREGKYTEAQKYLTRSTVEQIKKEEGSKRYYGEFSWARLVNDYTKGMTLQTVEVGEVTTFAVQGLGEQVNVVTRFEDGSSEKLRIVLVKEGGVWKINWIGKLEVEQTFRDYVVRIYSWEFFTYISSEIPRFLEILKGGHRIMAILGLPGEFFHLVQTDKANAMGKDITGNGIPNLVVVRYSGGYGGFATYCIYETGQKFRKIAVIDDHIGIEFTDLDGDSKLEIVVGDHAFISLAECNACYRPPKVILRYQNGAYRIAIDLMHKPAPSHEDLERNAVQVLDDASWRGEAWLVKKKVPESLFTTMLELPYTGHPDLAWQFLEMAWPPDISGKDPWLNKFRSELRESQYWPLDSKRAYFGPFPQYIHMPCPLS